MRRRIGFNVIENWINTEKQDALSVGLNDIIIKAPESHLRGYAKAAITNVPIPMVGGLYEPTGWSEDGDRVLVRLVRIDVIGR